MKNCISIALLVSCLVVSANAFFQKAGKKAAVNSPLTQEAVDIYGAKYSYGRAPRVDGPLDALSKVGVPKTDIDGTKILKQRENPGRRITDMSEKEVAATFNGLAAVYGAERAIEMVKIFPISMSFDPKAFAATFAIWAEIFGEEESKDMVSRNPGLLAIKPKDAGKNTDNTMAFSYIVAYTRPIGIFGPAGILALLSVPVIEGTTGIAIKQPFFEALGNIF
mmetsp:Transcript_18962/g.43380  ORF Transcript_18962/g.43380 Transcript_18962/m.43380 type:complete len:222 (+) Transcript_18962:40-705(+)